MHRFTALPYRRFVSALPSTRCRALHTASRLHSGASSTAQFEGSTNLGPRWLSDLTSKAEKGLVDGTESGRARGSRRVIDHLDRHWLALLASTEGFLNGPRWTGLDNQQVAWGDMDSMLIVAGHVNNVIYNRYAESSRVNWVTSFSDAAAPEYRQHWGELLTPKSIGLILKSIKTDYKFPIVFPDSVSVLHKLVSKPTYESTNIEMEAVIISHNHKRLAARCLEDIVVYDYRVGKKACLQPFMVDELRRVFDLQEETREKAVEDVLELQKALA